MTACSNSRRHGAVVAALVGAMALGAPAVALATGGIDLQFAEGGIEGTEFAKGTVTMDFTEVGTGAQVATGTDVDGNVTVAASEVPFTVSATTVTPAGSNTAIDVTPGNDYKVALYRADDEGEPTGTPLSGNRVTEAGDYVLTVTPLTGSDYVGQTFKQFFKVVPVQIAPDSVFEHGDTEDHYFMYTGSGLDLGFAMGGTKLVEGKDYTVKYSKGGKTYDEVVDAGTYTATLTGLGMYAGTSATVQNIEVKPYTLDGTSTIVVDAFQGQAPSNPSRVYWTNGDAEYDVELDPSCVVLTPTTDVDDPDEYTFTVSASSVAVSSGNVIDATAGAVTATAVKVDAFASFSYNGAALQDSYDILPGQSFNVNAVTANYNGTQLGLATVVADAYNGTTVPGEYKVTFEYEGAPVAGVNATLNGKYIAATKTVTIRVWAGSIDADEELWVYGPGSDTVAINSYAKAYDGTDLDADSFYVTNKDQTVTSAAGGELTVKLYDSEGNEVDSVVDAGEYKLVVTSDDYKLSGTTELPITIGKVDLTTLEVGALERWNDVAGEEYLPLTPAGYNLGTNRLAIINLDLSYDTGNQAADPDLVNDFKGLDWIPDAADVTVEVNDEGTWKPVARIDEAGEYRVTVSVGEDVASNFVLPDGENSVTLEFTAAEKTPFSDVQPGDWFYQSVLDAVDNQYMGGYTGTSYFGPRDAITRGQVACVLYNMAGFDDQFAFADTIDNIGDYFTEGTGWKTGFDDVDGHAYYAQAIAWAKKAGVVSGSEGKFRPDDPVSREEFAAMLANYAKVVNRDESVDAASLDSLEDFDDADGVSDWAKASVAWAVENDVMGNGGYIGAKSSVTRAEVAAMAVNYQPDAK